MEPKFLFVTPTLPGSGSGGNERSLSLVRALRCLGETRVLLLRPPWHRGERSESPDFIADLLPPERNARWHWRRDYYLLGEFRRDERLHRLLVEVQRQFPFTSVLCRFGLAARLEAWRLARAVIDMDDLPIDTRRSRFWPFQTLRELAMRRMLGPYRSVLVAKEADRRRIRHADIRVVPCISTKTAQPLEAGSGLQLLFVGPSGYAPNGTGVDRFIAEVLPLLAPRFPEVRLRLIGLGWERHSGKPWVDVAGYVDDLDAEYRATAVVVCPIWVGTGACVKVAEAANFGKAMVVAPHAARGFEGILQHGTHLLVADTPAEMAARCGELLGDSARRAALGTAAYAAAAAQLSQDAVTRSLAQLFSADPFPRGP